MTSEMKLKHVKIKSINQPNDLKKKSEEYNGQIVENPDSKIELIQFILVLNALKISITL